MLHYYNHSLKTLNTFGIDVLARRYFECTNIYEIEKAVASLKPEDYPCLILGGGSNILFTANFPGTVIHPLIKGIEIVSETGNRVTIRAGAGEKWDDLVSWSVSRDLFGLENLSFIPGSVGAAPVQNIGAYGVELKNLFVQAEVIWLSNGKSQIFNASECNFGYRRSVFKDEMAGKVIITHVTFNLGRIPSFKLDYGSLKDEFEPGSEITLDKVRNAIYKIRSSKLPDPSNLGNAGSFFTNPVISRVFYDELLKRYPEMPCFLTQVPGQIKIPAGWLIEKAGWKGKRMGLAGVHDQQALVLVNHGGASGHEIMKLAKTIMGDVKKKFGIDIEPEVLVI